MAAVWNRAASWLSLIVLAAPARADEPIPLAVQAGRCACVLPTHSPADKYLLVVGTLAAQPGPFRVSLRTETTSAAAHLPRADDSPSLAWVQRSAELRARLDKARGAGVPLEDYPPQAQPPAERAFHIFVGVGDLQDATGYVEVTGGLAAVGRHCQVYVDRSYPEPAAALTATIDDIIYTFDTDVLPQARKHLGRVVDVDRDGRFTILLSGWLGKLSGGTVSLGGFVRGSDFHRDLPAPYGNRCDMMALNANLKPGPHLRALLAHEYTHAAIYCEHVFGMYLPEAPRVDEESWINEGLAHLAEVRHGWSNLDYRLSAFLNDPGRYQLVVPDYYTAGLWRSPGHRGATYAFLRSCAAAAGPEFAGRLVRSNLTGKANLEAATGVPFAELFRNWTCALARCAGGEAPGSARLLCGPRLVELPLAGGRQDVDLAGTSAAYFLLHSPQGQGTRLSIGGDPAAQLQVTLLPIADHTPRLSVAVQDTSEPWKVRLLVAAHDGGVQLTAATWERLVLSQRRGEDTAYRPGDDTVAAWFSECQLRAGMKLQSGPIAVPEASVPLVFKVVGVDAQGRPVVGWAVRPASR